MKLLKTIIQTIVIVVVVTGLGYLAKTYTDKVKTEMLQYESKIDSLNNVITERDSMIQLLDYTIVEFNEITDSLYKEIQLLKKTNAELQKDLDSIVEKVDSIPANESYEYLINTAYPFKGEGSFTFNDTQLRGIRSSYQENIVLKIMNTNLDKIIDQFEFVVYYKDSLISVSEYQRQMLELNQQDLRDLISEKQKEIDYWESEAIRQKKITITGGTILGGLLILALL